MVSLARPWDMCYHLCLHYQGQENQPDNKAPIFGQEHPSPSPVGKYDLDPPTPLWY